MVIVLGSSGGQEDVFLFTFASQSGWEGEGGGEGGSRKTIAHVSETIVVQ